MNEEVQDQLRGGEVDEGLTIKGDLQESGLPELLKSLIQNRETGILTLSHEGVDKSIHLKEGNIVFAASTDPDDRLGETLLKSGKITLEQYFESAQHIRPGKRQGSVLIELGSITPDDLVRGIRDQVTQIVHSLFQWKRGEYKMVLKDLDTHDLVTLNISTPTLVFEGVRTITAWSRIYRGIGSSLDVVLVHAPEADNILYDMDLGEDESHLYGLATGRTTIRQICSMSYLSNFETCQCLWGFLCLGALMPAESESSGEKEASPGAEGDASPLQARAARFAPVFEAIRQFLRDAAEEPASCLERALLQVRPQHPEILDPVRDFQEPASQAAQGAASLGKAVEDPAGKLEGALEDLLYALLLQVKIKHGPEAERRLSSRVAEILHSSPDAGS